MIKLRLILPFIFVCVLFIGIPSCSSGNKISPETHELILKKQSIEKLKGFRIDQNELILEHTQNRLPVGNALIQLTLSIEDSQFVFVWRESVTPKKSIIKKRIKFDACDEIWINDRVVYPEELGRIFEKYGGRVSAIENRKEAVLLFNYDLLTFCSEWVVPNQKSGFRRTFGQKLYEGKDHLEQIFESNYILLNEIVYTDLKQKELIDYQDAVVLVDKRNQKMRTLKLAHSDIQEFLKSWE